MRNKLVLVELFQRVGEQELKFLVQSGSYFGFLLGTENSGKLNRVGVVFLILSACPHVRPMGCVVRANASTCR